MQASMILLWRGISEEQNLEKINHKKKSMIVVAPHTSKPLRLGGPELNLRRVLNDKVGRNGEN